MFRKQKQHNQQATKAATLPRDEKPRGAVAPDKTHSETKRKGGVKKVLSGDVLYNPSTARHYPFVLYCCLLILLYMGFVFNGQRTQREEIQCRIELQRLRARSLVFSSERIQATRHANIQTEIKKRNIDIQEWATPPHVITSNNEE